MAFHWSYILLLLIFACQQRVMHAAVTIDDFVDDVRISLPEQEEILVLTSHVGPYQAERWVYVHGGFSELGGFMDVNATHRSKLTLRVEDVVRTSATRLPDISPSIYYDFQSPVDLTYDAEFGAFLVDFDISQGPVPPQWLRLVVQQDIQEQSSYWALSYPLGNHRPEPFTAVFPFRAFRARGSAMHAPEFISVPHFRANFLSFDQEHAEWETRIDSIRVGALPEGDFNGNGLVEQADLDLILANWGAVGVPEGWFGELQQGNVDQDELDAVLGHWGTGIAPPSDQSAAIPEPNSCVLALFAAAVAAHCLKQCPPLAGPSVR